MKYKYSTEYELIKCLNTYGKVKKGKNKDVTKLFIDFIVVFFSKNLLRKKASILLGIRFDDTTYQELKKHLKSIDKAKDLVSDAFIINSLIIFCRDNNILSNN